MLEGIFHLQENQTTVRRELFAGLTTFMAMAYVVVVNPQILPEAGMPADGVLFATCLSAALATLVMGLWANYPIALAPGMSFHGAREMGRLQRSISRVHDRRRHAAHL